LEILLIRVAADQSPGGGSWNGPVDADSNEFAYVAIPEQTPMHPGLEKPYSGLAPTLAKFGVSLPGHLRTGHMHLDPDFEHLTYGDSGQKARQINNTLRPGDYAVFYAGLKDIRGGAQLVYAIIGVLEVAEIVAAISIPPEHRDTNAHARRVLGPDAADVVVRGRPGASGRLKRCLPIGEYRERAYRVRRDLLEEWGGLTVKGGYLQRSARLPGVVDPPRFLAWLERQTPTFLRSNN
jgi:hypothetical protein